MKKTTKKHASRILRGDLIYVEWIDTTGDNGWISLHDELVKPIEVRQAGFFIQRNKETLHMSWGLPNESCQAMDIVAIPVGTIKSIRKLKV